MTWLRGNGELIDNGQPDSGEFRYERVTVIPVVRTYELTIALQDTDHLCESWPSRAKVEEEAGNDRTNLPASQREPKGRRPEPVGSSRRPSAHNPVADLDADDSPAEASVTKSTDARPIARPQVQSDTARIPSWSHYLCNQV